MIMLVLSLALLGVLLWFLKTYVPMDPVISQLITIVVVIFVVLWLFGLFGVIDIPVPHLRAR